MVDTVSYSSVEGVFRGSFDKSIACNWGQDAGHQDAERETVPSYLQFCNYGANIRTSTY